MRAPPSKSRVPRRPRTGSARTSQTPAAAGRAPVRQLNSEVLPAPFGPMTAATLPARCRRSTPSRLVTPPKRKVRPRTSSRPAPRRPAAGADRGHRYAPSRSTSGSVPGRGRDGAAPGSSGPAWSARPSGPSGPSGPVRTPGRPGTVRRRGRHQALRTEDHHDDHDGSEVDVPVRRRDHVAQQERQPHQHDRPQDDAESRAHPTEDDHREHEERRLHAEATAG